MTFIPSKLVGTYPSFILIYRQLRICRGRRWKKILVSPISNSLILEPLLLKYLIASKHAMTSTTLGLCVSLWAWSTFATIPHYYIGSDSHFFRTFHLYLRTYASFGQPIKMARNSLLPELNWLLTSALLFKFQVRKSLFVKEYTVTRC